MESNSALSSPSSYFHSRLPELVAALRAALRRAASAGRKAWLQRAESRKRVTALDLMADLDAHTLKDIGAPNWLVAQAVERTDRPRLWLRELDRP